MWWTGLALDVLVNWTLFSLLVLDWPREATMTEHLNRILREREPGYRRSIAIFFCRHLLNPFDYTGRHCIACKELPKEDVPTEDVPKEAAS